MPEIDDMIAEGQIMDDEAAEALRQHKIKKNICRTQGCNNKARRIGKREYSNHCFKHQPVYYAQNSSTIK